MDTRDTVFDELAFIVKLEAGDEFTWKEITETKGILLTDKFKKFTWKSVLVDGPGWLDNDKEEVYRERLHVVVYREREENDEEYLKRKKEEQKEIDEREKEERTEYLRLKAKFEK